MVTSGTDPGHPISKEIKCLWWSTIAWTLTLKYQVNINIFHRIILVEHALQETFYNRDSYIHPWSAFVRVVSKSSQVSQDILESHNDWKYHLTPLFDRCHHPMKHIWDQELKVHGWLVYSSEILTYDWFPTCVPLVGYLHQWFHITKGNMQVEAW